ncbi:hypothetical protein [Rhodohalobacter sp.]|uniref:hypothetical protein n=1 Tax=Rhodohalobacter sp. TaxID=1974210 RepID=UPI002ACEA444|nr:hypothetical protein [Rhodohalobacter sp.]MDZ7755571.1 hypothetical protein [Rhodohalobacter sp.]
MKNRFSHIVRTSIISFLMAGMMAHLFVPFTSHAQKTAFTQWLNQNVASTGDESENELRSAILKLPEQVSDFRVLLEQASHLIASNKEDFRLNRALPKQNSDQVTSWLVGQWNLFQQQQTGTDALLPESPIPVQKWISSDSLSKILFSFCDSRDQNQMGGSHSFYFDFLPQFSIQPLISGISINAP